MKHPCKKCLVRAACSQECREWNQYATSAAQIMTGISLIISGIITVTLLLWATNIIDTTNAEWPKNLLTGIWIFSFSVATMIQSRIHTDEEIGVFIRIVFAPMIMITFLIIILSKKYFQRA